MTREQIKIRNRIYRKRYYEKNKIKCCEATVRWKRAHRDKVREYYLKGYAKVKSDRLFKKYYSSDKYKKWRIEHKKLFPEKYSAWDKANDATKGGKLKIERKCQVCKKTTKLHKHHNDYSKPLEVIFLCPACHAYVHGINRLR